MPVEVTVERFDADGDAGFGRVAGVMLVVGGVYAGSTGAFGLVEGVVGSFQQFGDGAAVKVVGSADAERDSDLLAISEGEVLRGDSGAEPLGDAHRRVGVGVGEEG